jgi:hypothetical protein
MIEGGWCVLFNSLKVQETPASLVSNVFGGVPIYRTMYVPVPTGRTKDLDIYEIEVEAHARVARS